MAVKKTSSSAGCIDFCQKLQARMKALTAMAEKYAIDKYLWSHIDSLQGLADTVSEHVSKLDDQIDQVECLIERHDTI